MGKVDYFTEQMTKKEVEEFLDDLNFWLDKVFIHQNEKPVKEAEYFMKELAERVQEELERMIWDRKLGK